MQPNHENEERSPMLERFMAQFVPGPQLQSNIRDHAREVNHRVCFSAMGVEMGQWASLPAPSSVTLSGRTYHIIHNPINVPSSGLRGWFFANRQEEIVNVLTADELHNVRESLRSVNSLSRECQFVRRTVAANVSDNQHAIQQMMVQYINSAPADEVSNKKVHVYMSPKQDL
jgi:hypothetical protein